MRRGRRARHALPPGPRRRRALRLRRSRGCRRLLARAAGARPRAGARGAGRAPRDGRLARRDLVAHAGGDVSSSARARARCSTRRATRRGPSASSSKIAGAARPPSSPGDTLFPRRAAAASTCPGSDPKAMSESLHDTLRRLPGRDPPLSRAPLRAEPSSTARRAEAHQPVPARRAARRLPRLHRVLTLASPCRRNPLNPQSLFASLTRLKSRGTSVSLRALPSRRSGPLLLGPGGPAHEDPRLPEAGAAPGRAPRRPFAPAPGSQEDNIKFEINSYDTLRARRGAARQGQGASTEVVVASIGPERVTQALRTALGMGADRAVHVKDAAADGSDALGIAKILAAVGEGREPGPRAHGAHVRRRQRRRPSARCSPSCSACRARRA